MNTVLAMNTFIAFRPLYIKWQVQFGILWIFNLVIPLVGRNTKWAMLKAHCAAAMMAYLYYCPAATNITLCFRYTRNNCGFHLGPLFCSTNMTKLLLKLFLDFVNDTYNPFAITHQLPRNIDTSIASWK